MNLFEIASRKAFRFDSTRGPLATEDLWQLPLLSKTNFDLNTVATGVNAALKAVAEESFVATRTNPGRVDLETKLEIVKHIIAVRIAENEAKTNAALVAEKRAKLVAILGDKQDEALKSKTAAEIQAEIDALGE